jgi:hypothetical protein
MSEESLRRQSLLPTDVAELYRHINGKMLIDYTNFGSQAQAEVVLQTWPSLLPRIPETPKKA